MEKSNEKKNLQLYKETTPRLQHPCLKIKLWLGANGYIGSNIVLITP